MRNCREGRLTRPPTTIVTYLIGSPQQNVYERVWAARTTPTGSDRRQA